MALVPERQKVPGPGQKKYDVFILGDGVFYHQSPRGESVNAHVLAIKQMWYFGAKTHQNYLSFSTNQLLVGRKI